MSQQTPVVITAYLRPKPGAAARLMALRPQLEKDFSEHLPGFVSATLLAAEGSDEWRDVVVLDSRAGAEASVDGEAYQEWSSLVELTGHDICEQLSRFER